MKDKISFTRVAKFKFESDYYQMFKADKDKIAFLKIDEKGEYIYPTYEKFCKLVRFFSLDKYDNLLAFKNGSHIKYDFLPCVRMSLKGKISLVMITSSLVLTALTGCANKDDFNTYSINEVPRYNLQSSSDIVYDDTILSNGFVETDDYELLGTSKYINLYNNKYFDELFGVNNYSLEEINQAIDKNNNIPDKFKAYLKNDISSMNNYYNDLDFRIFYYNISNLNFVEKNQEDIILECGGLAYYDYETNTLSVSDEIDLEYDALSKIIFRHEVGHLFNNIRLNKDGFDVKYNFNKAGRGKYINEALDVIFTTEPFLDEYSLEDQDNMGYPITSNILRVIVDSLPNYSAQDSIDNNVFYLQNQMYEFMDDDIEASVIVELLELQWTEYENDAIEVDKEEYVDLYSYITRMYIKSNINENMSYEEIVLKAGELKERLCRGVRNETMVYTSVVDDEFNNYLNLHNIEANNKKL